LPTVNYNGDRVYFPNAVTTDEIQDVLGAMTASAKAVAEFGLMMGTASIAEPLSGLAGIATGNIDNIAKVQDALTYQPKTRAGQVAMRSIAKDVSNLANETGLNHLSGYWRDRVVPALQDNLGVISGSVLAAGGLGLITAMSEFVPGSRATRAMPFPQEGAFKYLAGDLNPSTADISHLSKSDSFRYESAINNEDWDRAAELAKKPEIADLPMDNASRMARAEEMGFNVDHTLYHGTSNLDELKAFDKSQTGKGADQYGPGFYLTDAPHEASGYAEDIARGQGRITGDSKGVIQANTGGRLLDVDGTTTRGMEDSITLDRDQIKGMLMESDALRRGVDSDDMNPMGDYYESFWESGPEEWMIDDLADRFAGRNPEELTDLFDDNDKFLSALSDATGYDGIRVNWPDKSHEIHWKPENIRSVNAAFDPAKRSSSNLLAGTAAATPIAAALLSMQPDDNTQ
tara:strand:+ start:25227 stop:26603 length:1377 start_codon:yes stop_codon:yes gene_type:complete